MTKCKKCGADILFLTTKNGKWFPVNEGLVPYKQDKDGEDLVVTDKGEVIRCTFEFECTPTGMARIPHWATCPYANDFRRGNK